MKNMNPTPIQGSVNEKGIFTAKNPYVKLGTGNPQDYLYAEFENAHPDLLTYTPSNVLVTDEEHVEVVGPVVMANVMTRNGYNVWTKVWPFDASKCTKQEMIDDANKHDVEYRECYITIPPTEKAERDFASDIMTISEYNQKKQGKKYNYGDEFIDNDQVKSAPLSDTSDVECTAIWKLYRFIEDKHFSQTEKEHLSAKARNKYEQEYWLACEAAEEIKKIQGALTLLRKKQQQS